jgi:hypothetical protein
VHGVGSAGGDADQLLVGSGGNSRGRKMTFAEACIERIGSQPLRPLQRIRAKAILRDPDLSAGFEAKVRREMELPAGAIDWSQIDWEQVMQIVILILKLFGV